MSATAGQSRLGRRRGCWAASWINNGRSAVRNISRRNTFLGGRIGIGCRADNGDPGECNEPLSASRSLGFARLGRLCSSCSDGHTFTKRRECERVRDAANSKPRLWRRSVGGRWFQLGDQYLDNPADFRTLGEHAKRHSDLLSCGPGDVFGWRSIGLWDVARSAHCLIDNPRLLRGIVPKDRGFAVGITEGAKKCHRRFL